MKTENISEKAALLLIDDPLDFSFHAAYVTYSKAWNKSPNETRIELNRIMLSLAENKEDYFAFYKKIGKYREDTSSGYSGRISFKALKKRAWRKNEAKKTRLSRHKT